MAISYTYFSADYFSADYFAAQYFGTDGSLAGALTATIDLIKPRSLGSVGYWSTNYWSQSYWSESYWADQYTEGYFYGTYAPAQFFSGNINSSLASVTANFDGSTVQVEILDLSVFFGVTWTISEFDTYFGDLASTLAGVSSSFSGFVTGADNNIGGIATTLGAATASFSGTHVAPPNVAGTIATVLDDALLTANGVVIEPGSVVGVLNPSIPSVESAFLGSFDAGTFTGSISQTLDDVSANWVGGFFATGTIVGPVKATLADVSSVVIGTFTGDATINADDRIRSTRNVTRATSRKGRGRVGSRSGRRRA